MGVWTSFTNFKRTGHSNHMPDKHGWEYEYLTFHELCFRESVSSKVDWHMCWDILECCEIPWVFIVKK